MNLPDYFKENIVAMYGEKGRVWLKILPLIVHKIALVNSLEELSLVKKLNYNCVFSGSQYGNPIILKVGPDYVGMQQEEYALKAFSKSCVATVLASGQGWILINRAVPGQNLVCQFPDNDVQATTVVCRIIRDLHKSEKQDHKQFLSLKQWLRALDGDYQAIVKEYLAKARLLRDYLLTTTKTPILLHGDLHHENILKNGDGWLVIDPKGIVGDPVYEVTAFLKNPRNVSQVNDLTDLLAGRIALITQSLGFDEQRIKDWLYVKCMVSWVWYLQDNSDATHIKNFVQRLKGFIF